ncbi:MAG: hypothetical protein Q8K51_10020 [Nitrospirota bacterium]|nr:hypothetical protein [Nitrospirota bacterium]
MKINKIKVESEKLRVQILFRKLLTVNSKFLTKNKKGVFYV